MAGERVRSYTPKRAVVPLPSARLIGLRSKSEFDVVKSIEEGFSTAAVGRLAKALSVPESRVLSYVDIPASTFHARKRQGRPLSAEESSRVYRIAKVTAAAEEYFDGDKEAARRWLASPKSALGSKTPIGFARTSEGSEYVVKLLNRMAHGVIS